jgi:hypothetical protein
MKVDKYRIYKLPKLFKRDTDLKLAIEALEKVELDSKEKENCGRQLKEP